MANQPDLTETLLTMYDNPFPTAGLTEREVLTARYIVRGWTHAETAHKLRVSPETIKDRMKMITTKTGYSTRELTKQFVESLRDTILDTQESNR